jgi:hypothetical protein
MPQGQARNIEGERSILYLAPAFSEGDSNYTKPIYIGFARWEIEYRDVNIWGGGQSVVMRLVDSGQGSGHGLPILKGAGANSHASNKGGISDPDMW